MMHVLPEIHSSQLNVGRLDSLIKSSYPITRQTKNLRRQCAIRVNPIDFGDCFSRQQFRKENESIDVWNGRQALHVRSSRSNFISHLLRPRRQRRRAKHANLQIQERSARWGALTSPSEPAFMRAAAGTRNTGAASVFSRFGKGCVNGNEIPATRSLNLIR